MAPPKRKQLTLIGGIVAVGILAGTVAIVLLINHEDLYPKPECVDPVQQRPPSDTPMQGWSNAAISCDAPKCAAIGRGILQKGGQTADAAIATLLCQGIYRSQSMGIGGGFLMMYYNRTTQKSYAIIARETAPAEASEDMFQGNSSLSQKGGLAVGVPGELKGYQLLYKNFGGGVSWSDILQPTIDICKNGYEVDQHTYNAMKEEKQNILNDPGMREIYINPETNDTWQLGDIIKRPKLAETLEIIASKGVDAGVDDLYKGELAELLVQDIQDAGGIITLDDMANYTADLEDPIMVSVTGGYTLHAMPPPGSGVLMAFILRLLSELFEEYGLTSIKGGTTEDMVQTYHLIIEAFKHAYAKRTHMGDYLNDDSIREEVEQLIHNLTQSEDYLRDIIDLVDLNTTHNSYEYYGAQYYVPDDHGTSHMSIVGPDGDAVSCTSTVNLYFGAGIRSRSTGIVLNDEMDDFSAPNITNYFGVPPSPNNFIRPGKRPLSSMTPAIFTDSKGDVKLVVGAAGGTRITTSTTLVALRNLWFNETIKEAIDAPRIHHQLFPMELAYECGTPRGILDGLRKLNHVVTRSASLAVSCAVARAGNNTLYANADFRKQGSIDGL